ncbi:MAG: MgtC/SapB family protein [Mariprofundus sp.]
MEKEIWNPELWTAVAVAMACGTTIGFERQLRGKAAGVRTAILISLGTSLFVFMGLHIDSATVDSSRVLGQVVTGIGFLGAGVMLINLSDDCKDIVNSQTTVLSKTQRN